VSLPQPGPPAAPRRWQATAAVAAAAAIVTLAMYPGRMLAAAGVLAAGTAITAWGEARRRGRGQSSDISAVLMPALAGAFVLACLLGLAAGHASADRHHAPGASPPQRTPASQQAQRQDAAATSLWFIISQMI
jgi:hypothetical protein